MPYKLYLDDLREPRQTFPTTSNSEWAVVKSFAEFVAKITKDGLPFIVSFDHDLGTEHYKDAMSSKLDYGTYTEKTGYHCAKWLIDYCMDHKQPLPKWNVHSANPVGKANITSILTSFENHHA